MANVGNPTLAGLGTNFGLWPLVGKTLAVISDARLSARTDAAVVVERLLSISGEDGITLDRKNLAPITCRLPVRFVILTNELPSLNDAAAAVVSRLIVLHITDSWLGREDVRLTDKLVAELPGILAWAVQGWQQLRDRGHFRQPQSGKCLVEEMNDLASPVGEFVRDCCLLGPKNSIPVDELFRAWRCWCMDANKKDVGTRQVFGRDLRRVARVDSRKAPGRGGTPAGLSGPRSGLGSPIKAVAERRRKQGNPMVKPPGPRWSAVLFISGSTRRRRQNKEVRTGIGKIADHCGPADHFPRKAVSGPAKAVPGHPPKETAPSC